MFLLGRFENMIGRQCVFVEAAICLEEIAFEGSAQCGAMTVGRIFIKTETCL